jgi:folate-dependent phosphoribosylglycinamide formyltransferase PurN
MTQSIPKLPTRGEKFEAVICLVGKDLVYSVEAIMRLCAKDVAIAALCGETAEAVWSSVSARTTIVRPVIFAAKRPWESADFFDFLTTGRRLLGINCGFDYIIPPQVLESCRFLNVHPAALPFNKGCHHSFWGIMDKTPLGASLHWMVNELDAGPLITSKIFQDDGFMTAEQIQSKSNMLCLELLEENIKEVMTGVAPSCPQGTGTYHSKYDILKASTLDETATINVDYLFDLCRATANKGNGFIIRKTGRKFLIRISSIEELQGDG